MQRKLDDRQGLKDLPTRSPVRVISKGALRDRRIARIMAILRAVELMPWNWTKGQDAWKASVSAKYKVAKGSVYRWKNRFDESGIAGLQHTKANRDQPKSWTPAALNWWIGQALLPANRKIDLRSLYQDMLIVEAKRRCWRVGGWSSAMNWLRNKSRALIENKT